MSQPGSESATRKRIARGLLLCVLVLLRGADFLLAWYLQLPGNGSALLSGALVGSCLCTTVLIVGVWRRQSWARYLLIAVIWACIALFSYPIFLAWGARDLNFTLPFILLFSVVVLYALANSVLICSRRIRHLATMSIIGRSGRSHFR